ncbi:hypothetical protein B0A50_05808 [Salinomyces thailandicus]|uniref:Uncharacterized protein n=1 Tax=Salinomyces thailandicus TaxID=706561 RepID=A0A4U0TTT7_9PEZI|nr:hypothetical protein B0A50_05808 [Salinomyces thailandica]
MDPAGLLISIATIACTLDELSQSYNSATNTLSLIRAQVKVLETGTQRIQEWLHFTDPQSKMQVHASLRDAVGTVDSSLQRLHEDIVDITHTGPKTSKLLGSTGTDQWMKTKFIYNESRLRSHLTDVRECASLLHFTLNVCQLPIGQGAELEVRELGKGAKALKRAQTSSRRQRRSLIEETSTEGADERSEDYDAFMKQVMDAEAELPDEEPAPPPYAPVPPPMSRFASASSVMTAKSAMPSPLHLRSRESTEQDVTATTGGAVQKQGAPELPDEPEFPDDDVGVAMSTPQKPTTSAPGHVNSADYFGGQSKDPRAFEPAIQDNKEPVIAGHSIRKVPPTNQERHTVYAGSSTAPATRTVTRQPPSRPSVSGSSSSASSVDRSASSSRLQGASSTERTSSERAFTASPAASTQSLLDKGRPVTQRLSSLHINDSQHTSPEQKPPRTNSDGSPRHASISSCTPPLMGSRSRKNTSKSSLLEDPTPHIVRLAREARAAELGEQIKQGVNVNEVDSRTGRTAVMEAIRGRAWPATRLLMQNGARLHLRDVNGHTALHHAAIEGDAAICQQMLDSGASAEEGDKEGLTPLDLAARNGHTEAVLCLIRGAKSDTSRDAHLVRGFLEAIKSGNVATVQAFLTAGEVKPKKIKESWKPAAFAAQSGSLPMLNMVLTQKLSLKERNPAGWTPLHYAARYDQTSMVHKLLELKVSWKAQTKKAEETALHIAAAHGHSASALALVAHKDANVIMKDTDNIEPIHHAFRSGDIRLTAALLEKGAKLHGTTKYGWKPVHLAAAYGHESLLAECVTRGVSIEEKLMTPAFKPEKRTNAAARRGYWAEIRWPHSGARPLHLALEFGHLDVARVLIAGGAKIDEGDSRAWRPLHHAAFACLPEMVELLLDKGAANDACTVDGHNARTLGFRKCGLDVDQRRRFKVVDLLETALASRKKSKLGSLTSFMNSNTGPSRTATQRNLCWHTAQMAENLYYRGSAGVDVDDAVSLDGSSISVTSGSLASDELTQASQNHGYKT